MTTTMTPIFDRLVESTEAQIDGVVVKPMTRFEDHRGWLIEMFRNDEIPADNQPAMAYLSETEPGAARGPHEHVSQSDLFFFVGPGDFKIYLWDVREDSPTYGIKQTMILGESYGASLIVPPGVVHAYRNVSRGRGWVFNAPNRLYAGDGKREPVDEIRHEDREDSPYVLN